jgi:hypothetical protein
VVCAGLTSNHWHKEFIPGNASLKMTPDDEMSVEKCISVLLGSKSLELVRFLTFNHIWHVLFNFN